MPVFNRPAEIHAYRAQTASMASCNGVMAPSFRCVCCGQSRGVAGRTRRIPGDRRSGWVCRECQR